MAPKRVQTARRCDNLINGNVAKRPALQGRLYRILYRGSMRLAAEDLDQCDICKLISTRSGELWMSQPLSHKIISLGGRRSSYADWLLIILSEKARTHARWNSTLDVATSPLFWTSTGWYCLVLGS